MTFVELAHQIDQANVELDAASMVADDLARNLDIANLTVKEKRDNLNGLMAQMRNMLGLVTIDATDTGALKQLALEGQKLWRK